MKVITGGSRQPFAAEEHRAYTVEQIKHVSA